MPKKQNLYPLQQWYCLKKGCFQANRFISYSLETQIAFRNLSPDHCLVSATEVKSHNLTKWFSRWSKAPQGFLRPFHKRLFASFCHKYTGMQNFPGYMTRDIVTK